MMDPLHRVCYNRIRLHISGIHQTIQKNSVGFILWDGITVGKNRIPWEKDRQWVLFYAPATNCFTTLSVIIQFWCFLPFWNQETKPKTLRMNLRQSDQFRLTDKDSFYSFSDMENHFGFTKQILIITWNYNSIIISIGIRLTCQ